MKKFFSEIGVYAAVSIALIGLFIFLQPRLTKILPSDYSRHKVVMDALSNKNVQPSIIFFGDSRTIFGVNTKQISEQLPTKPLIYNLSSVGQSFFEGSYFISSVPAATKHVFHCVEFATFNSKTVGMENGKAISMVMNGYRIDKTSREILQHTDPVFDQNAYLVAYEARTSLKSSLHNYLRIFFDDEKFADNFHDLYFPHTFTSLRHKTYPHYTDKFKYDSLQVSDVTTSIANRINSFLKSKNIQYHIVLMPLNADISKLKDSCSKVYVDKLKIKMPGIDIINLSTALSTDDFYDGIHANRNGANKLSLLLAGLLKERL